MNIAVHKPSVLYPLLRRHHHLKPSKRTEYLQKLTNVTQLKERFICAFSCTLSTVNIIHILMYSQQEKILQLMTVEKLRYSLHEKG